MRITLLSFLLLLLPVSHAYAWEIKADFETGTVGSWAQLPNPDAFHGAAGDSKYVNAPVFTGSQAGSVTIKEGENGFADWGGAFDFPSVLRQGDVIEFSVSVYYPSGWDFSCGGCTQGMKFMRIHTASSSGQNEGFYNTLIKGGSTGGLIVVDSEVNGEQFKANNYDPPYPAPDTRQNLGSPAPRDQWITYKMLVKFHSSPGQGMFRVWQNGKLIFEDLKTATLRSSTSVSDYIYLYTYWNNGAPKTQTSYVDNIVITSIPAPEPPKQLTAE